MEKCLQLRRWKAAIDMNTTLKWNKKKKKSIPQYKTYRLKGTREMTSTFLCNAVIVSLPFVLVRMKRTANSHIAGLQGLEDWSKFCINYQ